MPQIERDYVDTGEVTLAFRHLPLTSLHPDALKAAEAAECAGRQDHFWEMHDALFSDPTNLGVPALKERAHNLNLDETAFNSCLEGVGTIRVRQDASGARQIGINSTPTFLIGTRDSDGRVKVQQRLAGAKPAAEFAAVLDPLIASAR